MRMLDILFLILYSPVIIVLFIFVTLEYIASHIVSFICGEGWVR
jgi:hypothetical protein